MIMNEHYKHPECIRKTGKAEIEKTEKRFVFGSLWNDGNLDDILIYHNTKGEAAENPLPHFSIMTINLTLLSNSYLHTRYLIPPGFERVPVR